MKILASRGYPRKERLDNSIGAIGGMLGLSGGAGGTGFSAPQGVNIAQPVSVADANAAQGQTLGAITDQQNLLKAIQGQGGLQNQSQVYGQLQGIASGTGPNPAQAMLNQQTGANIANQAALMAGQRGAGANVGLMARQAAQAGGNLQQQAIGQGSVNQANQSLNAINSMGNIANTQVANQMGVTQSLVGANQAQQANLLNAIGQQNTANVNMQSGINAGNAALAGTRMGQQPQAIGKAIDSAGSIVKMAAGAFAHGGVANGYYDGGGVNPGPQSSLGQYLSSVNQPQSPDVQLTPYPSIAPPPPEDDEDGSAKGSKDPFSALTKLIPSGGGGGGAGAPVAAGSTSGFSSMSVPPAAANGGMVPVVLSPGEKVISPNKVEKAAGGKVDAKVVPGTPKVAGDSLKNDTYKTKLQPGSIVVPRTKSGNDRDAASFVRNVLAKRGRK